MPPRYTSFKYSFFLISFNNSNHIGYFVFVQFYAFRLVIFISVCFLASSTHFSTHPFNFHIPVHYFCILVRNTRTPGCAFTPFHHSFSFKFFHSDAVIFHIAFICFIFELCLFFFFSLFTPFVSILKLPYTRDSESEI